VSNQALEAPDSITAYVKKFPYRIRIKLGRTYTNEFKEFHEYCLTTLGTKYKDWFIVTDGGTHNDTWTLWLKDDKKSMFLALKYSECIDKTTLKTLK
jgi:hypothetical protein